MSMQTDLFINLFSLKLQFFRAVLSEKKLISTQSLLPHITTVPTKNKPVNSLTSLSFPAEEKQSESCLLKWLFCPSEEFSKGMGTSSLPLALAKNYIDAVH